MLTGIIKESSIKEFINNSNITLQDISFINSLKTNSKKIEATVELFKDKKVSRFSSIELGAIIFYPENDLEKIKKRTHATLSYMFRHEREILKEINIPYSQYLRLTNGMMNTNMHKLLGFDLVDDKLERASDPIYKFKPSHNDWHKDIILPYSIDEVASFGLGVIWRRGAVMEYVPPELTTLIYADENQKDLLADKVRETLQKMFRVEFIMDENKEKVIYPKNIEAEYGGLKLKIQSMAIGSFLTKTAGLPLGPIYGSSRKNLPKIEYISSAFLEGYKCLMPFSRDRWFAVTQELAENLLNLLIENGTDARIEGKSSPHCIHIKT